jgi:ABC-type branched-subunit amino acid transport system substrate-binding protein
MAMRRRRTAIAAIAAACLAVGVVASGAASSKTVSSSPYVIGYDAGITGGTAAIAQGELAGIKAYINLTNSTGGVAGRQLKLVETDSKGVPTTAVSNMVQLTTQDKALVVFGDVSANSCQATVPSAVRAKTPVICGTVSPAMLQPPQAFVYTKYGAEATEAGAMESVISKQLKLAHPKVAILALDTTSTQALFNKVAADVKAHGGQVVFDDRLPVPPSLDMSVQAQKIVASGANVVVEEIIPQQLTSLKTNLRNLKSDIPIIAEATTFSYTGLQAMHDPNIYELALNPVVNAKSKQPAVRQYVAQLRKLGYRGQNGVNAQSVAISYSAMADVVAAMRKCGAKCTTESLDANLEKVSLNLPGINTGYSYTSARHYPQTSFFLYRWSSAKQSVQAAASQFKGNPLSS